MTIEKAYKNLVYWVERSKEMEGFGIEENIAFYRTELHRLLEEQEKEVTLDYKVSLEGLEQVVFLTDILLTGRYNFTRLVTIDRKKATFELSYLTENQKNLIDTLVALLKIDKDVLKGLAHYEYVSDAVVDVADMVVAEGTVK